MFAESADGYGDVMGDIEISTPKSVTGSEELVVISRKIFERLVSGIVSEENILRWSREAKRLKKAGKLPVLRSLKELR